VDDRTSIFVAASCLLCYSFGEARTNMLALSLSLSETAFGSELTDSAEVVVEGDVVEVRQRTHEVLTDYPVRVLTVEVTDMLKGSAPATVELVLPGGFTPDGGFTGPYGGPMTLAAGDHVLLFARLRDLEGHATLAEASGVRMLRLYRRVLEDGRFVARDASERPVTLDEVAGQSAEWSRVPAVAVPDGAAEEVQEPRAPDDPPAAEWAAVVQAVRAEVAAPGSRALRAVDLEGGER
jgi:hypothetical protein